MTRPRKHPEPKVGDVHGVMTVVHVLPRHRSTFRVVCRCVCGYESAMYEHNMYTKIFGVRCTHKPGTRKSMLVETRRPHAVFEEIETFTREERRVLFDRLLENYCFDTSTNDGRPCAELGDEECAHNFAPSEKKVHP